MIPERVGKNLIFAMACCIDLTCRHVAVCETDHERVNSNVIHGEFGIIFQIKQSGIIAKELKKKKKASRAELHVTFSLPSSLRPVHTYPDIFLSGYFSVHT